MMRKVNGESVSYQKLERSLQRGAGRGGTQGSEEMILYKGKNGEGKVQEKQVL